ncbi:carbamoyltransferase C-terminal domain-containing protein [Pelagicoccus enzymogenes]|uniref:carbamoyltransferase family protein n=1 Tax=Pelagicoccus enzymogenes TaxID=2773457 RepID=UPI00280CAF22|nr:carbamoyltransferase C-terminal domain-containing protein [Pelagicoccus enzymogenes]MDQ8199162.1 carbamoyltransferase C-terminal domain-containing protein [Pelagicoccus enzymogenes]
MKVLGIAYGYHDSAAALVVDGALVVAAQEERFSRVKNDSAFPMRAIEYCLSFAGGVGEVDLVVYYEDWKEKFDRIVSSSFEHYPLGRGFLENALRIWVKDRKFDPLREIRERLVLPRRKVKAVKHHESHAAAAYYLSPFSDAAVVTLDGVGEHEVMTISHGDGDRLTKLVSQPLPDSLGLFYSAFTSYLGFKVNEDEYKVMGMAGFGEPRFFDKIRSLVAFQDGGRFTIDQRCFNFLTPIERSYNGWLEELLGPSREQDSPFFKEEVDAPAALGENQRYADIAASLQKVTEEIILHVAKGAMEMTGSSSLCLGGGVALNSLANGRLQRELGCPLSIHPASGDAGGAVGAALLGYKRFLKGDRRCSMDGPYLGKDYGDGFIEAAIASNPDCVACRYDDESELLDAVAEAIVSNEVVGWFQGRFEWGPRALGNRSILGNAAHPDMQEVINRKIKFREPFRPFAPAVLPHRSKEYFELAGEDFLEGPESFMLSVQKVRPEKRALIPAVTHIDGSARVQLVREEWNGRFYRLIKAVEAKSGIPIVINTSFNLKGEPIVTEPADAMRTFEWSDMDMLVMENWIVRKAR